MSLRRGARAITGVYRGSRAVAKILRGTALVYESGSSSDKTVLDNYTSASGAYSFSEIDGAGGVPYTWRQSTRTLAVQDYEDADRPTEAGS